MAAQESSFKTGFIPIAQMEADSLWIRSAYDGLPDEIREACIEGRATAEQFEKVRAVLLKKRDDLAIASVPGVRSWMTRKRMLC